MSIVVATFGDAAWMDLATERAVPSAHAQTLPAREVLGIHEVSLHQARNRGAWEAQGEWLLFLDADDQLDPGYLEAMATGTADLRGPAVRYIRDGRPDELKIWPAQDLRDGNYLVIGTLVRRDMFWAVGGFRDWPIYEDWCLWQRCWKAGATIESIPDAVYVAHVTAGSRNRAPKRHEKAAAHDEIRRANFPELYQVPA